MYSKNRLHNDIQSLAIQNDHLEIGNDFYTRKTHSIYNENSSFLAKFDVVDYTAKEINLPFGTIYFLELFISSTISIF